MNPELLDMQGTTASGLVFSNEQNKIDYHYSSMREVVTSSEELMRFYQTGKINPRRFMLLSLLQSYSESKGFRASDEWLKYMLNYDGEDGLVDDMSWLVGKRLIAILLEGGTRWVRVNVPRLQRLSDKYGKPPAVDMIEDYERGRSPGV